MVRLVIYRAMHPGCSNSNVKFKSTAIFYSFCYMRSVAAMQSVHRHPVRTLYKYPLSIDFETELSEVLWRSQFGKIKRDSTKAYTLTVGSNRFAIFINYRQFGFIQLRFFSDSAFFATRYLCSPTKILTFVALFILNYFFCKGTTSTNSFFLLLFYAHFRQG